MPKHVHRVTSVVVCNELTGERAELDSNAWTLPALETARRGTLPNGEVVIDLHGVYAHVHSVDAAGAAGERRRLKKPITFLKPGARCLVSAGALEPSPDGGQRARCWPGVVERVEQLDVLAPTREEELRTLQALLDEAYAAKRRG